MKVRGVRQTGMSTWTGLMEVHTKLWIYVSILSSCKVRWDHGCFGINYSKLYRQKQGLQDYSVPNTVNSCFYSQTSSLTQPIYFLLVIGLKTIIELIMLVVLFFFFFIDFSDFFLPQRRLSLKFLELGMIGIKATVMTPNFIEGQWINTNLVLDHTSACEGAHLSHLSDTPRISLFLPFALSDSFFPHLSFCISLSTTLSSVFLHIRSQARVCWVCDSSTSFIVPHSWNILTNLLRPTYKDFWHSWNLPFGLFVLLGE